MSLSKVTIRSDTETRVDVYDIVRGRGVLVWSVDLVPSVRASRIFGFKNQILVSSTRCKLWIRTVPTGDDSGRHHHHPNTLPVVKQRGHFRVMPIGDQTSSPGRPIKDFFSGGYVPVDVEIEGMRYYLDVSSILTLSTSVLELGYPPYSLSLERSTTHRAYLVYEIGLSPSEGESAEISLTAIESLSSGTYAIIKGDDGKELTQITKGSLARGEFPLPMFCSDAGIHIWTPYGFSVDIGQDPATSLAIFHSLRIEYRKI